MEDSQYVSNLHVQHVEMIKTNEPSQEIIIIIIIIYK